MYIYIYTLMIHNIIAIDIVGNTRVIRRLI